jgi:hypothetical protein
VPSVSQRKPSRQATINASVTTIQGIPQSRYEATNCTHKCSNQ